MKYKMIVADFDDTILHDDLTYSDYFVKSVHEYIDNGGKFVIATGRMTSSIVEHCKKMGLTGEVISYQGGIISDIDSGEILSSVEIDNALAVKVARCIEDMGVFFQIYENDIIITNKISEYSAQYAKYSHSKIIQVDIPLSEYIKNNMLTPVKMLIMEHPDKIFGYIDALNKRFSDTLLINTSKKWIIEVVSRDINKGIAVAQIAKEYGIDQQDIICIGDSPNDLSMLEYAGLAVAVENAVSSVKEIADIIAPSNNQDGVAYIIRKYGLNENV